MPPRYSPATYLSSMSASSGPLLTACRCSTRQAHLSHASNLLLAELRYRVDLTPGARARRR